MKEKCDRALEEANAYNSEKEKLGNMLLDKKVEMREMASSLVGLKRTVNRLSTEKCSLMKKYKERFFARRRRL